MNPTILYSNIPSNLLSKPRSVKTRCLSERIRRRIQVAQHAPHHDSFVYRPFFLLPTFSILLVWVGSIFIVTIFMFTACNSQESQQKPITTTTAYFSNLNQETLKYENPIPKETNPQDSIEDYPKYCQVTYDPETGIPYNIVEYKKGKKIFRYEHKIGSDQQRKEYYLGDEHLYAVEYFINGIKVKREEFSNDSTLAREIRYRNNEQGLPLRVDYYNVDKLLYYELLHYNDQNQVTKLEQLFIDSRTRYVSFFKNDHKYRMDFYDTHGLLITSTYYFPEEKGNEPLIQKQEWYVNGVDIAGYTVWEWTDDNKLQKKLVYAPDGTLRKYYIQKGNDDLQYFSASNEKIDLDSYKAIKPDLW